MAEIPDVRPGQVWADNDKRSAGRKVRVVEVDGTHAVVVQVDARGVVSRMRERRTRIRLDRFRPTSTGYRLVTDTPADLPGIEDAAREALDAIGDDEEYAHARTALVAALAALADGTTAEAHRHLTEALRMIDEACPDLPATQDHEPTA